MHGRPSGRSALVVVVLCVAVSGCLGVGPSSAPTPTPTATPTANTDCPPTLTVSELDEEPADVDSAVAYENLSAEQRATFDRARDGSAEDFDYAWHDIDLVAHDGTYYRVGIVVC